MLIGILQVQMAGAVDPIAEADGAESIKIQLDESLKKQLSSAGVEAVTEGVMDACESLPGHSLAGVDSCFWQACAAYYLDFRWPEYALRWTKFRVTAPQTQVRTLQHGTRNSVAGNAAGYCECHWLLRCCRMQMRAPWR